MEQETFRRHLLDAVPDRPVWLEARAALLDPACRLFGDSSGYVIRSNALRLGAICGVAPTELIREALSDIRDAGEDPTALWAVVQPDGFTQAARSALAGWSAVEADIFGEPASGLIPATEVQTVEVRWMRPNEAALLEDLPNPLSVELAETLARSWPLAAVWQDDRPVSFCYAACESDGHWDVSINTRAGYRRKGLAGLCVTWMAEKMRARGKRAVWGAHVWNRPSRRLAGKLGFEPSGRLCLFENWQEDQSIE